MRNAANKTVADVNSPSMRYVNEKDGNKARGVWMDFRVRTTLASIDDAFLSLLKEKALTDITVKELCESANINRATFYRHFKSTDDVMERAEHNLLMQLDEQLKEPENEFGHDADQPEIEETLATVLEAIKCDSERYFVLFSENGDPTFPSRVLSAAYDHSTNSLDDLFPTLSENEKRWMFDYVAYGLSAIWKDWIEGGMVEPAKDVARFATELINHGVSSMREAI